MTFMSKTCTEQRVSHWQARLTGALKAMAAMALLALATVTAPASAAPAAVESFDKATWPALLRNAKQPAIVIFTSVTCTHCPGAIANLAKQRAAKGSLVPLLVVSMDADDDAALLRDAHYAPADRLFAFRGNPQALQFAVNPDWRGMTPYVAFVDGKGSAKFVLGEPKAAVLDGWLKAAR